MGMMSLKQKTNHLVRCDLCKKSTHYVYNVSIDGQNYKFCSGEHANQAANNYKSNKERGVKPSEKNEGSEQ